MVDVREAAHLARRTPETIRRWVWSSRLGSVKQGNKLLVPRDEVLAIGGDQTTDVAGARTTLKAWVDDVERTLPGGVADSSARDLVLADRAARS